MVILRGYPFSPLPASRAHTRQVCGMEGTGSPDEETFGTLRLPRGGKHGYLGVRGSQGKRRDRFQAYATIDAKKVTVPGLFASAHDAAVALAMWKQDCELGLSEEPSAKRQRRGG